MRALRGRQVPRPGTTGPVVVPATSGDLPTPMPDARKSCTSVEISGSGMFPRGQGAHRPYELRDPRSQIWALVWLRALAPENPCSLRKRVARVCFTKAITPTSLPRIPDIPFRYL